MTLRHLNVFLTVCQHGTMTRAAEALHVSQPPVSQAVAELEAHYGTKLFERLGRGVRLTPAGEELRGYAAHIADLMRESERRLASRETEGPLRVGASLTAGTELLPDLIQKFSAGRPGVRFSLVIENTAHVVRGLLEAELDLGFVEGPTADAELVGTPVLDDELVLIGPPGQFTSGEILEKERLEDCRFFVRERGSGTREVFETAMAETGVSPVVAGEVNDPTAIVRLVAAGLGVGVLSRLSVRRAAAAGEVAVLAVRGLRMPRQIRLVTHRGKYVSPLLAEFREFAVRNVC